MHSHFLTVLQDPWYKVVVSLQDMISVFTMEFWSKRGLQTMHLPVTTGSISSPMGFGSDSLPVKINMFGVDTYLADSMQFVLEYGCRIVDNGCYYLMPSFRGEAADESHLCQFYHSEAEIHGSLDTMMSDVEAYLKFLSAKILNQAEEKIYAVTGDVTHIERLATHSGPLRQITFDEAAHILKHDPRYITKAPQGWRNLTRAGEQRLLAEFSEFVWVREWDHLAVPFYQAFADTEQRTALNADLLFGIGEVIGAGERHRSSREVDAALALHQVGRGEYEWYCTMKDQYPLQTAGFGMGVERFMLWMLKHNDIRDLQLLPRFNGVNIVP